jgi:hypothetical protein
MTVVFLRTGERHVVVARDPEDRRIAWTKCGRRTAVIGPRHRGRALACQECFA